MLQSFRLDPGDHFQVVWLRASFVPAELSLLPTLSYLYCVNLSGPESGLWCTALWNIDPSITVSKEKTRTMSMSVLVKINFIHGTFLFNQYSISPIGECHQSKKQRAKCQRKRQVSWKGEKKQHCKTVRYHSWKMPLNIKSHALIKEMKKSKMVCLSLLWEVEHWRQLVVTASG